MLLLLVARFLYTAIYFFLVSLAVVFVIAIVVYKYIESKKRVVHINGNASKQFEPVLRAFRENFRSGWERDGGAFAVFFNDELVVDIWGGYADKESQRLWREDTMNVAFSSSKAVGALCVALLVDRGLLRYEDKVTSFWPNFGRHGKDEITVQMILSHTAGLAVVDRPITQKDAADWTKMAVVFEDQTPNWTPGTAVGYHALTYGWLVDQIIRRVDPKQRGIGQFFREEIGSPHGIDFHLGLPLAEAHRVSRLSRPTIWDRVSEFITDPGNVDYGHIFRNYLVGGMMLKVASNPTWLQSVFRMPLNNPELYAMEQCAVSGIGTARDLARLFDLVRQGKIISQKTLDYVSEPVVRENSKDLVTAANVARGHGLTHLYHDDRRGRSLLLLGHAGFGGQNVRVDRANNITFAYLSNGLKGGLGDRARTYVKLVDALYKCVPLEASSSEARSPVSTARSCKSPVASR